MEEMINEILLEEYEEENGYVLTAEEIDFLEFLKEQEL